MEFTEEMIAIMNKLGISPEQIVAANEVIFMTLDKITPLAQRPLLCMIFEKIAFDNKMSVTDLVDEMHYAIHEVDKDEGKYIWHEDEIKKRNEKWKEERPTGEWEFDGHHMRCKQCGVYMCTTDREGDPIPITYCPNCGRKMEG